MTRRLHIADQHEHPQKNALAKLPRLGGTTRLGPLGQTWTGCWGNVAHLSQSQADYLKRCALRATLLYALDVNGYRRSTKMPFKFMSDDELLECMHKARAKSAYIPEQARDESRR